MSVKITSRENTNVKDVVRLIKDKKFRDSCKSFVVEGKRLCNEVLLSNISIKRVLYTQKFYDKFQDETVRFINAASKGDYCVSEEIMSYMSDTDVPQGIMCVCEYVDKFSQFNKIVDSRSIVALENVQNPSNLGTILRTCDAMGVGAVILTEDTCDIYNPKVIRGSMGSIFHLSIIYTKKSEDAISLLKNNGFSIFAMVLDSQAVSISNVNELDGKKVLFVGNEGNGLLNNTIKKCSNKITIPMNGKAESLNVAVATSIAIWEITGRGI